jgi:hypothetical protein
VDLVYHLFVFVHLIGMASLVGGWLVQVRAPGRRWVHPAILHGALTQLVTGLVLVGLAEGVDSLDRDVDRAKIAVKLVVALLVVVLAMANRRRETLPDGVYVLLGVLAIGNVAVAALWT